MVVDRLTMTAKLKRATDENLRGRVMSEIKLLGDFLPSPFVPSLLATFSDRSKMYAVMGCVLSSDLACRLDPVRHRPPKFLGPLVTL